MKKRFMHILSLLIKRSEEASSLKGIQWLLSFGIPFNKPHSLKLLKLDQNTSVMHLPFKRRNKNHLGTVHACAIATLGEFPAGLLLLKSFPPDKFRVVMTELNASYLKHASSELIGKASFEANEIRQALESVSHKGQAFLKGKTLIFNTGDEKVAEVATTWQLKAWQ